MYYKIDEGMYRNSRRLIKMIMSGKIYMPVRKRKFLYKSVGQTWTQKEWCMYSALKYRYLYDWFQIDVKNLPVDMTVEEKELIMQWYLEQTDMWSVTEAAANKLLEG